LPHPANASSPIGQLTIGNLTEGDISGTTQAQAQEDTEKLIQSTEKGLSSLQRSLNAQEQETAKQIKKFLDQAREALAAQDAGGAKTLAIKANLLLNELKK
jgi:guanylate kinase